MIQRYRCSAVGGVQAGKLFVPSHNGEWVKYEDHAERFADLEVQIKRQDLREWLQEKNAKMKALEEKVEELRDGNEYILVRELRAEIDDLKEWIAKNH